jgi:hypothetical protein
METIHRKLQRMNFWKKWRLAWKLREVLLV